METEYSNIRKKINAAYYALYVLYVLLVVVFGFLLKDSESMPRFDPLTQPGQSIAYVVILYVIASIPGALWFFKRAMKTVSKIENEEEKQAKYLSHAMCRLCLIGLGAALAIVAFYMLGTYQPMLWCAGIAVLAQFFCKPSDRKIYLEMNDKNEEDL